MGDASECVEAECDLQGMTPARTRPSWSAWAPTGVYGEELCLAQKQMPFGQIHLKLIQKKEIVYN